jgi:glycine/D-amino acid oxidase-like deaminating enzyme
MTARTIAVVGAGILGCLIARELAGADPDAVITVVDRDLAGSGVTRRSAGLSLARGSTPRTRQLSELSHRYYERLKAACPELPMYPLGARILLPGDPVRAGYLPEITAPEPAEIPGQAEPSGLGGTFTVPDGERAWRLRGCHYADVYALTQRLAAMARPRVRFAESVRVTGLDVTPDSVILRCGSGDLAADQVVLAPGPWIGSPAWRDLLAPLGLRVKKIVAMHIERRPSPGDEAIIFDSDDAFLLPLAHRGHWLFSYTSTEWDVDPDEVPGLSAADVAAARDCLSRYSPELAAACQTGRVCCDAYSPNREPVVAALDARIVFAGAANGSGYRLAPGIASEVVGHLTQPSPA